LAQAIGRTIEDRIPYSTEGLTTVAGVDEVGVGAFAGAVIAAGFDLLGDGDDAQTTLTPVG
jgi:hypothetical protein